ncbi:PIH1 domain-containing protein 2-like [Babylonia areolata]|uniref:PIH1 domain-containing protein 2-like n=1 Tax=Babylonia areolata TaxID=304850 RepID=UPI003FD46229
MDALKALKSMGMGGEAEGPGGDKLLKQAQHIWSMLDDMAEQDPQAYSRFIEKQTNEYKQLKAPPQPHLCVRTQFLGTALYVNIMSWQRVPKPKSAEDNIPLFAAPLDNTVDKKMGETISTIAIATNPEVLAEYGIEAKDAEQRKDFINLTLDYVQHFCGRPVDRNFILLPRNVQFKGDLEKAQQFFTDSLKKALKKDKEGQTAEQDPAPDIDLPESMLSRLANISTSGAGTSQSNGSSQKTLDDTPIILPETKSELKPTKKKQLIQELNSEETTLRNPGYILEKSSSGDGLELKVDLPGVTSVSQCELDISEDDVKLYVEGQYELTVQLPSQINDSKARAKFSKKQSTLTLHMPLLNS